MPISGAGFGKISGITSFHEPRSSASNDLVIVIILPHIAIGIHGDDVLDVSGVALGGDGGGAALALAEKANAREKEHLTVPGGHVGAVVGSRASKALYPAMGAWLRKVLANQGARPEASLGA